MQTHGEILIGRRFCTRGIRFAVTIATVSLIREEMKTYVYNTAAALTMYLRSRKLADLPLDPTSPLAYAELQLEALSIAMNALSLVEGKNTFLVVSSPSVGVPVCLRIDCMFLSSLTLHRLAKGESWATIFR